MGLIRKWKSLCYNVMELRRNNWDLGYWILKRKTLSSVLLISCYLTQYSCLRWSGSVVHCRSVFRLWQSTDRYMLVITARVFRLFGYPQFVWSTDRYWGTAVAQWLRFCATNQKVAGSIPAGVIGIFLWYKILLIALWPWGRVSL